MADLAPDGTASASTTLTTYVAANVQDGDLATWHIHTSTAVGEWLKIDLGAAATITDYRLGSSTGVENRICANYDLESSNDDSNWTVRYQARSKGLDSGVVSITSASGRYWRVIAIDTAGSPDPWAQGSFELHGTFDGEGGGAALGFQAIVIG